jgi:hypothetical protein
MRPPWNSGDGGEGRGGTLLLVAEIVEDCLGLLEGIGGDCLTFLLQIDKQFCC